MPKKSFGAPIAPKLYSRSTVPEWIFNSRKEVKQAFLRAIFDDDGSIMYSENFPAKGINLYQTRHKSRINFLESLLNQIKQMLSEFGILSGKLMVSREYNKVDGKHIVAYLNITDFGSIVNFDRAIGLSEGMKFEKLQRIVRRGTCYSKAEENLIIDKILTYLKLTKIASTKEIADKNTRSTKETIKKLKKLELKGLVERVGRIAPNRSIIWRLKEVTT